MRLYHNKCKTSVVFPISSINIVVVEFGLGSRKLLANTSKLESIDNDVKTNEVKIDHFYCETCKEFVDAEDLFLSCGNCGTNFPLDKVFRFSNMSMWECGECIDHRYGADTPRTSILSIVRRIDLQL